MRIILLEAKIAKPDKKVFMLQFMIGEFNISHVVNLLWKNNASNDIIILIWKNTRRENE